MQATEKPLPAANTAGTETPIAAGEGSVRDTSATYWSINIVMTPEETGMPATTLQQQQQEICQTETEVEVVAARKGR